MRPRLSRRMAAALAAGTAVGMLLAPTVAWAAPSTQVIQGDVLRLVSVADWDAASSLLPGASVQWDVEVSADAPDPGIVHIGVSARGSARLILDIATCPREWAATGCPGGATVLRTGWSVPRDGAEIPLTRIADTDTAHLRLAITLDPADGAGSTDLRVHAAGAGESAVVGPDGGLATTGLSSSTPWAAGGGAVLVLAGATMALVRLRRADRNAEPS